MNRDQLQETISFDDTIPDQSIAGKVLITASNNLHTEIVNDFRLDDKQSGNPVLSRVCMIFILGSINKLERTAMQPRINELFDSIPEETGELLTEIYNNKKQTIMQYLWESAPNALETALKMNEESKEQAKEH